MAASPQTENKDGRHAAPPRFKHLDRPLVADCSINLLHVSSRSRGRGGQSGSRGGGELTPACAEVSGLWQKTVAAGAPVNQTPTGSELHRKTSSSSSSSSSSSLLGSE
ncbi:unnamed protein product [Pleuronectes platessa]|uniref:Uncharacterized protein n=1 Tax=Pleuronectes platessa TaxID=8262 RepID=A0A9N7TZY6_PLEPL|nr:unnamed protein product [Pleuronectes platessa]